MGFVDVGEAFLFWMIQLRYNWRKRSGRPEVVKLQQLLVTLLAENDDALMGMNSDLQRMIGLNDLREEAFRIGVELRKWVSFH